VWERIDRGNLLLRCGLQARSARQREALRRPQGGEGRGILWRPPAYSLFHSFSARNLSLSCCAVVVSGARQSTLSSDHHAGNFRLEPPLQGAMPQETKHCAFPYNMTLKSMYTVQLQKLVSPFNFFLSLHVGYFAGTFIHRLISPDTCQFWNYTPDYQGSWPHIKVCTTVVIHKSNFYLSGEASWRT